MDLHNKAKISTGKKSLPFDTGSAYRCCGQLGNRIAQNSVSLFKITFEESCLSLSFAYSRSYMPH